jgi:hypothetical protein
MATYECVADYGAQPGADYVSQSANWVVCVFRFRYPATYSRQNQNSFTTNYPPGLEIRGKPLIITGDCLQLQVQMAKSQHTPQMSATLAPGINYESEIFPGDWCMAWMFTNDQDFQDVLQRMTGIGAQGGVPLNGFRDGLKFVGRVSSIRKSLDQAASGHRQVRYALTGTGFQEMDAQIFYDPLLADQTKALGLLWGHLDADISKLIREGQRGIDINKALPYIIDLLLGRGIPRGEGHGGAVGQQATAGLEARTQNSDSDATFAYGVPTLVAQCLGISGTSPRGIVAFADILETTIGIQQYDGQSTAGSLGPQDVNKGGSNADLAIAAAFMPENLQQLGNRRLTTQPLLGDVLPQAPQFNNVPVWSILRQYLNPGINEMYMTLRVNQDGRVMPTFIARQFPFTTDRFVAKLNTRSGIDTADPSDESAGLNLNSGNAADESAGLDLDRTLFTTRYLNLPTWGIDPVLVNHVDVGRSDALRFNFVHVYGNCATPGFDKIQIIFNPPIRDDLDISRSGLRPYMATVPIWVGDVINHSAGKWMNVLSDFLMGQHMTMTGTMNSLGIQAPVCIGDNVEWDGDTYHIEAINHSCSIDGNGMKVFNTGLSLSHGIRTNPLRDTAGNPDMGIYSFLLPSDESTFNPGITSDQGSQPAADLSVRPGNIKDPGSQ